MPRRFHHTQSSPVLAASSTLSLINHQPSTLIHRYPTGICAVVQIVNCFPSSSAVAPAPVFFNLFFVMVSLPPFYPSVYLLLALLIPAYGALPVGCSPAHLCPSLARLACLPLPPLPAFPPALSVIASFAFSPHHLAITEWKQQWLLVFAMVTSSQALQYFVE